MELQKIFKFEASHILPKHPGKCSHLHGHSWVLTVCIDGVVNPAIGFVMDYADISAKVKPLIERLDHHHLGQWITDEATSKSIPTDDKFLTTSHAVDGMDKDFYPSSENLIVWIGKELFKLSLCWSKLILNETDTSSCILTFDDFMKNYNV